MLFYMNTDVIKDCYAITTKYHKAQSQQFTIYILVVCPAAK